MADDTLQKTVEATHILYNPKGGKIGTLNEDDDDDDIENFQFWQKLQQFIVFGALL